MSPTGLQRSRALWDNCRTTNYMYDENSTSPTHGWSQTKMSRHFRAILYEIQPIRYSVLVSYFSDTYRYLSHVCPNIVTWGRGWVPQTCNHVINTFRALSWDQWKWAIAIALYYVFLRWIHETLDAGPVVLILTALTAIFTVGLSDQTNMDGLSAYSVFNKGFQKIMGSIDAEDLLQQHLGGGGIMHMIHRRQVDDNVDLDEPRHRRPRQQNNQRGDVNNIDNGDNQDPPAENNINHNRARRTGKKARRDRAAIEQRREIRAQRDAALAMGFGHNDEDLVARIVIDDNDDALDDGN